LSGVGVGAGKTKLRIVAESARPEGTVSQVARAHGIAPSQLFTWRRQLLAAAIGGGEAASGFVPVRVTADPASAAPARVGQPIDIRLPSGIVVSVGGDVDVEVLRRVLTAPSGR
jgi:transposase